jgi:hypothetical protein
MTLTNEIILAAERLFHASGAKPKDPAAILQRLAAEFKCEFSVDGGLLTIKQTGTMLSAGSILSAYRQKYPRDFFGESGEVRYKSDLQGDNAAKTRFIREHGFAAWDALPFDEKSPGAKNVVTDAIPSAMMRRSDYQRLSLTEKATLAGEIGAAGIEQILGRK